MTGLLINLIVAVLVVGLLIYLIRLLPLPTPFPMILQALVVVLAILWLLRVAGLIAI